MTNSDVLLSVGSKKVRWFFRIFFRRYGSILIVLFPEFIRQHSELGLKALCVMAMFSVLFRLTTDRVVV